MAIKRVMGILEIDDRRGQLSFFETPEILATPLLDDMIEANKLVVVTGLGRIPKGFRISIQHMKGVSFFR